MGLRLGTEQLQRIAYLHTSGLGVTTIGKRCNVSETTVRRILGILPKSNGSRRIPKSKIKPPQENGKRKLSAVDVQLVLFLYPEYGLSELAERFHCAETDIKLVVEAYKANEHTTVGRGTSGSGNDVWGRFSLEGSHTWRRRDGA